MSRLSQYMMAVAWLLSIGGSASAALIAHYDFNESSGPTLNDGVGTADGTATDVVFVPSGAGVAGSDFGNAGTFNGTTSKVVFGEPASFDLGVGSFTIAGWFKTPTNLQNADLALFQNQSFSGGGWSFEIGRADRSRRGQLFFTVGGGSSAVFGLTQAFSNGRLDNNQWHWAAAVVNGTAVSLYIDGILQNDGGVMQPTSSATAPAGFVAGFGTRTGLAQLYSGEIDDWSIYDHALSSVLGDGNALVGGELYDLWQVPEPAGVMLGFVAALSVVSLARMQRTWNQ